MPEVRDGLDALLLGCFLFGLLLAFGSVGLGVGHLDAGHGGHSGDSLLPFGIGAILVAVAWFGGIGFVLRRAAGWPVPVALVVAVAVGLVVGGAVQKLFRALGRAAQGDLRPEAYRLPGTLGHVATPIRAGGVGEVIYEQGGVRQVVAARAADGEAIGRGTEVVVLKVERGTATVQSFAPLLGEEPELTSESWERSLPPPD